ncbi:Glycosylphosphatidylinositol (GPI) anchor assembly protein [Epicoccum nigrum]|nr:Glycosylphosphatidylinositol (GPI) anchor assembly protein [Epicoccum nigrum]
MASAPSTPAAATGSNPPASPIEPLPTDLARSYTHVHPLLLLSLFAWRFDALVADPAPVLLSSLLPVAALQVAYVALCLPPTSGSSSAAAIRRKVGAGEKKKGGVAGAGGKVERGWNGTVVPAFLSLLLTALAATPLLAALLVLFGAPATTHHEHTLLAAAHMAVLGALPLVYVHGVRGETWRQAVALLLPVDEVYGGLIGTVVGAWLGAVPVPLDWDREWQQWPVTIVTGAYVGYALGKVVGGTVLRGKKVLFE